MLLLSTAKLSWPLFALTVALYISNPDSQFVRIPNMIWLKQSVCVYNWLGEACLYAMLFYICLNWIIAVAATYQVFLWNRYNSFYGDWLYVAFNYYFFFPLLFLFFSSQSIMHSYFLHVLIPFAHNI